MTRNAATYIQIVFISPNLRSKKLRQGYSHSLPAIPITSCLYPHREVEHAKAPAASRINDVVNISVCASIHVCVRVDVTRYSVQFLLSITRAAQILRSQCLFKAPVMGYWAQIAAMKFPLTVRVSVQSPMEGDSSAVKLPSRGPVPRS